MNWSKRFEVHSHTHYSNLRLLDSINKPIDLINKAIDIGLTGIAITDHECLSSAIEVNQYAQQIKDKYPDFKIALGNEIYLTKTRDSGQKYYHFILIAKDAEGHKQLRKLSSQAWFNVYSDRGIERVPTLYSELEKIIRKNPGHLIATTACIGGELGSNILTLDSARKMGDSILERESKERIVNFILWCKELFGKDFYFEVAPAANKEQIIVNQKIMELSIVFDVKVVVGSDAHYLTKEDRFVHEAFLNSKGGERETAQFYEYAYLQSYEDVIINLKLCNYEDEYIDKIFQNSLEIYDKIENYNLLHSQQIPKVSVKYYPIGGGWLMEALNAGERKYPILSSLLVSENDVDRYWVNTCLLKLSEINKFNDEYLSRLEYEADIKKTIGEALNTNMFAYPVTLQHYVDMFWECGSMVGAGRGSSCSGLNHYLLGITQLDPIQWGLPFWRYLNKERFELGDIDLDLCPSKRPLILQKIKEERGLNFNNDIDDNTRKNCGCTLIATFGTETAKSAVQTACRGYRTEDFPDGIDVDTAQYLSSLIPEERGFLWSLNDVVNGNSEKGRKPVATFVKEVSQYPGLLDIMMGIEGLISRRGSHASGVILFDEDPYEFGCFMRTPSGDVITQYDLHMCEAAGMTKYDFLVTEVQDKLVQTIQFLQEYNEIESDLTLRQVYDKYLHPNVLPIDDKEVWNNIKNVSILDLFQFDSSIGSQAAKKIQPSNIHELTDANGLMRLMPDDKDSEQPMDKYVRFKNNIDLWYQEMKDNGLTEEEMKALEPHFLKSYGVPPSQEQLMTMLMDKNICGFTLKEANAARKIVGKKRMDQIPMLREQVYNNASSPAMGRYVWKYGLGPQMGYAFSIIHALAYSFIGFQTAYIATKWNPIYWDTACLVVNSGALDGDEINEDVIYEESKKPKEKGSDYAKIAKAISTIQSRGINLSLININTSDYGFKPDIKNNRILYGLKAISNINSEIIELIKKNRPYNGIKDFMIRCPLKITAMVNLIKAGAFDEVDTVFTSRKQVMAYYLSKICEPKTKLNLQNFNGLLQHDLIPKELELTTRVYNFNKYLKTYKKIGKYYQFDDACMEFFNRFLVSYMDEIEIINGIPCILQTKWEKIYQTNMNPARTWLKENQTEMLKQYNAILFKECWDKYASGNESHWEMDSLCFYYGDHELKNVDINKYGISDFFKMPETPIIDYFYKRGKNNIPIYKLYRIIGTVLAKDDKRCSVILLTTTGVVTVKFTREHYSMFKKQISQIQPNGKKKVMEKGWFKRGNMIMITGFRRDDQFVGKTYKATVGHQLYKITEVKDTDIILQHERWTAQDAIEEDEVEW